MTDQHDHYANARNLAIDVLRKETRRTPEHVHEVAVKAAQAATIFAPDADIDVEALSAELRHLFSVAVDRATVLDDPSEHVPWLPSKRASIDWRFWGRYMTYLERDFGMPPAVVNNLHELTDTILERIEAPDRPGPWDRRGMVVGSVQSGKTANYTGLICKAVDAGYKLVIVLAGLHSNLRSQTQLRLDEGVLGFDTRKSRRLNNNSHWVGVGKLPGEVLHIHPLTSSAENGDFSKKAADTIGVMLGSDPVLLVVKKNSAVLKALLTWVLHVAGTNDPEKGRPVIRNVPLLLIDDEADNASINTKDKKRGKAGQDEVSVINGRIREILAAFDKSAYVGYTATPFANIFINPEAQTDTHGEDIFPRSFIINVKSPSNYIGPSKVFGLDGDPDAGISAQDGLPIIRPIADFVEAFPPKHKTDHEPASLPDSLNTAIRCFILACAARRARGQTTKHNSMLVHVTRWIDVQERVVRLVRDELVALRRRIQYGDGNRKPSLEDELRALWEAEFVPVSQQLGDEAGEAVSWSQVCSELHPAASKIVVLPINGYAKEVLDYKEHEVKGLSVIAIGGDKLSRGLTLEGLSISYFLRTSKMYDTLMQMGRWFGYRPGYLDLCRLFTTDQLISWYRHIAMAESELRREFDYMVKAGLTPEKYGLRVRTHPDGMIVTALNKMCHSQKLELSWEGVLVQTTQMPKDIVRVQANMSATEALLRELPGLEQNDLGSLVWKDVPAAVVAGFVDALQFPPESARASGRQLANFIYQQATKPDPELTRWTVVLVSNSQAGDKQRRLAGYTVGLTHRTPEQQFTATYGLKKANILNPADESHDFRGEVFDDAWFSQVFAKVDLAGDRDWLASQIGTSGDRVALELTRRWQETSPPRIKSPGNGETRRANGRVLRALRRRSHSLLLIYPLEPLQEVGLDPAGPPVIGIALSFPTSDTIVGVEYRVNTVWDAVLQEDAAYDD